MWNKKLTSSTVLSISSYPSYPSSHPTSSIIWCQWHTTSPARHTLPNNSWPYAIRLRMRLLSRSKPRPKMEPSKVCSIPACLVPRLAGSLDFDRPITAVDHTSSWKQPQHSFYAFRHPYTHSTNFSLSLSCSLSSRHRGNNRRCSALRSPITRNMPAIWSPTHRHHTRRAALYYQIG